MHLFGCTCRLCDNERHHYAVEITNRNNLVTHYPHPGQVKHADVTTPISSINGSVQQKIDGSGDIIDTTFWVKKEKY